MYLALCIVLCALFISLAISKFFITSGKWAKINKYISAALGAAGLVLAVSVIIEAITKISSLRKAEGQTDKAEWASDVFSGYLKDVLPVLVVLLLIILLSAVFQPQKLFLRATVTALSSILILIYGYIASFLVQNENVSVTFEIRAMSVSISLLISFCGFFDFKFLQKKLQSEAKNVKQDHKKKKKQ